MTDGRRSVQVFFERMGLHLTPHEVGRIRGTYPQQPNRVQMLHLAERLRTRRARMACRGREGCSCWPYAVIVQPCEVETRAKGEFAIFLLHTQASHSRGGRGMFKSGGVVQWDDAKESKMRSAGQGG
jgi:hypothetical protein